jgi:hypothetical protein
MVTIAISGHVAEMVKVSDMIANPAHSPDMRAYADYWGSRTERRYGNRGGYRVTLTAPAWVLNWIMDTLDDIQYRTATDLTRVQRKAIAELRSEMLVRRNIRKYEDGPSRAELEDTGYLPK